MLDDAAAFNARQPIDLVAISGDLAKEGRVEEFGIAQELLIEPLMALFELDRRQIVIVPGNHDVDRGKIPEFIERSLAQSLNSREQVNLLLDSPDSFHHACERLENWAEFHRDFYGPDRPAQPGPLGFVHDFELDGHSVGVAALNSAWRSSKRHEQGELLLGTRQVESALNAIADADLRIVVTHHPLGWLAPFDAEQAQAEYENRGAIVLSGHEHKAEPAARRSPYGEVLQLGTGSLYLTREYPNGFEIVDVDTDARKVVTHLRRWRGRRGVFDADLDTAEGGSEEFDLPSADRRRNLGHPRFSTVMRSIAEAAQDLMPEELTSTAPATSVEDVLIEPRFLEVPLEEAEAEATLTGRGSARETDPLGGEGEAAADPAVILVAGPSQAGVSSALLWLLAKAYRRDVSRMPAFMRARDSGLGTTKAAATLAKSSTRFGYRRSAARDPDLYLGIDDFDQATPRKQDLIIEFMRTTPRHRYIVGCDEDWVDGAAARLEDSGIHCRRVFLAPFDSRRVHQLGSAMNSAPSDVERIDEMMSKQQLSRNPLTTIALLTVLAGQRDTEPELSEHALLEAYVNFLLDSGQRTEAERLEMSFRQRAHLLGELAHALYDRHDRSMSNIEAEDFLVEYFTRKGLRHSASRVLQMLIAGSILRLRNEQVSFRHPTMLNLFMGHWMLGDPARRRELLADCGGNAEVIRHAASLQRDDEEILAAAGAHVGEAIAASEPFMTRGRVDEMLEQIGPTGCWKAEKLGRALALLPPRRMVAEIDAQGDRIPDVLSRQCTVLARPWFEVARRLNEAVSLLSDVLKSSELVDNVELKRETVETAISGWLVLIGLLIAEDASGEPFRGPIDEFVAARLDDRERLGREPERIPRSIAVGAVLFMVTIPLQGRLGCRSLSTTIESCLADDSFTASPAARCLATWLHASIGTAGWPRRLEKLLGTLPADSLLRDATLTTAAHLYRSSPGEPEVRELEPILIESIVPAAERGLLVARKREQQGQQMARRLQQIRRAYQQRQPEDAAHGLEASTARRASRIA